MIFRNLSLLFAATFVLAACAAPPRTTVQVAEPGKLAAASGVDLKSDRTPTSPASVELTREDITDRKYQAIGDIKVVVSRNYLPDPDPRQEEVDDKLRETAAGLGADAVILIRYGSAGITAFSWGKLEGQGRAVFFVE